MTIPRPTDMDVDGSGQIFISSWRDGGFTYSKPNDRLRCPGRRIQGSQPRNRSPTSRRCHSRPTLVQRDQGSGSSVLRLAAQRELLHRALNLERGGNLRPDAQASLGVQRAMVCSGRVAAVFTLAQALGSAGRRLPDQPRPKSTPDLRAVRPHRHRATGAIAAGGRLGSVAQCNHRQALTDPDPRVRAAAAIAVGPSRQVLADRRRALLTALTADVDPIVAHVAVQALVRNSTRRLTPASPRWATRSTIRGRGPRALGALHEVARRRRALDSDRRSGSTDRRWPARQHSGRSVGSTSPRPRTRRASGGVPGPTRLARTTSRSPGRAPRPSASTLTRRVRPRADPVSWRGWLLGEMIRNRVDLEANRPALADPAPPRPTPNSATAVVDLMVSRPRLSRPTRSDFLRTTATDPVGGERPQDPSPPAGCSAIASEEPARPAARSSRRSPPSGPLTNPDNDLVGVWADYGKRQPPPPRPRRSFVKPRRRGRPRRESTLGYACPFRRRQWQRPRPPKRTRTEARRSPQTRAWARTRTRTSRRSSGRSVWRRRPAWVGESRRFSSTLTSASPAVRQAGRVRRPPDEYHSPEGPRFCQAQPGRASQSPATPYEVVLAAVLKPTRATRTSAAKLFERQGCVATATRSPRPGRSRGRTSVTSRPATTAAELVESILKPSARIAQGFETQKIGLADGRTIEGLRRPRGRRPRSSCATPPALWS